jgi:hypothetical protein
MTSCHKNIVGAIHHTPFGPRAPSTRGERPRLRGANGPVYAGRTAPSTRGERPRLRGANGPVCAGRTIPARRGETAGVPPAESAECSSRCFAARTMDCSYNHSFTIYNVVGAVREPLLHRICNLVVYEDHP